MPQLNPYASAAVADDKAETHAVWRKAVPHIETPEFCPIERGADEDVMERRARSFLKRLQYGGGDTGVFAQPNSGTEGRLVRRVAVHSEQDVGSLMASISAILREDDALLREDRGNVRFRPPGESGKGFRRITFRVNAAWNGREFVTDSGYAQVAPDQNSDVASRGRGGEIVDINTALSWLYGLRHGGWSRIVPIVDEIEELKSAACAAAAAIYAGTGRTQLVHLIGVDLLLEVHGEGASTSLVPVLLEANPRPAGLAQSQQICGASSTAPTHTVSTHLFDGAADLVRQIQLMSRNC